MMADRYKRGSFPWRLATFGLALIAGCATSTFAHAPVSCPANAGASTFALPKSLVPEIVSAFGLHDMPADDVVRTTVVRCMDRQLLACVAGANLPCGKANTNRTLPQGILWCRSNPNADFIPAYITGHDSIYRWRCAGGAPVAAGQADSVDAAGYIARYWKILPSRPQ